MGYTKLNIDKIKAKALDSKKAKEKAFEKANKKVQEEKEKLIQEFQSHPVTLEIASGPKSSNISRTLNGYGNLFSFIGFESDSDPITPLKDLLMTIKTKNIKVLNKSYSITVQYPSKSEIEKVTPLPFENGRSWAEGIEKGISGFTQYVYAKFLAGRSKEGYESKNNFRTGDFRKTPYLRSMINNFIDKIKNK